ncbi:MAG: hypothetical protein WCY38_00260 [Endomicrobiia bacterium]
MKKILFVLLCCTVFVVGCNKKQQNENAQDENFATTKVEEDKAVVDNSAVKNAVIEEIERIDIDTIQQNIDEDIKALPADERTVFVMGYKADLKAEKGLFKEAIDDYTKILEFKENSWTYGRRGVAKSRIGDLEGASDDFNKSISLGQAVSWVYTERGDIKRKLNDVQGAIADYEKSLVDEEAWKYETIAEMKREIGDNVGADAAMQKAKELNK